MSSNLFRQFGKHKLENLVTVGMVEGKQHEKVLDVLIK